jgi:ISXO2 transposase-like protein/transposase-like zinc ribbon protein
MFPDEDACKAYLHARRWPDGVQCPRCGNPKVYDLKTRKWHWQCEQCAPDGYRFSITTGTIFENTNKAAARLVSRHPPQLVSKKGMSARQIWRYMGFGSLNTAWLMCHKVRVALMEDIEQLGGIVEVDETFVGGLAKNRHKNKRGDGDGTGGIGSGKTPIVGVVSRKGNVVARVVANVKAKTLKAFVRRFRTKLACSAPTNGRAIRTLAKTSLMPLWIMPRASTSSERSILKPLKASNRATAAFGRANASQENP